MDLIGVYLREAMGEGCPICRILRSYEGSQIDTILYEHVNDPEVRKEFQKSFGLCTYHAWKTLKKAYSEPLLGPLGVAVIYESILSRYITSLEERKTLDEGECFLCELVQQKEMDTIEAFADRIEELLQDYENSNSILCKKHYEMLLRELSQRNPKTVDRLQEIQVKKLKELQKRINSFIDKFDYRAKEEPTKEEASSLPLTIEALKGLETGATIREHPERKRRLLPWR